MSRKPAREFTRPVHSSLAVVLQVREGQLQTLLWQRAREPFAGAWALPGGVLSPDETLEQSILRHLAAKVDVRELSHLEQLETLGEPDRYPDEWQLATVRPTPDAVEEMPNHLAMSFAETFRAPGCGAAVAGGGASL